MFKKINYLRLFNAVFLCLFIYILFEVLFNEYSIYWTEQNTGLLVVGVILSLCIILFLSKILKKLSEKGLCYAIGCSMIAILGLQILFAINFKVNPTWDFGIIYNEAISMIQGNPISHYFYDYYPNNIGVLILYNGVFKVCNLLGITNYLNILIIINIILIDSSIVALLYLIKKLYTLRIVALLSIIMVFITPFYCYVTIVYTDTLTMIFPILSFLLYYNISQSEDLVFKKKAVYIVCIGILLTIGAIIKMNVIITLAAMLIHSFFTQKNKQFFVFALIMLSCFIGLNKFYSYQVEKIIPIPYGEAGLPPTHWVMMGLKDNGRYNLDEAKFSISLKDLGYSKERIREENLSIIKSRITDYGVLGMIDHIREKIDFTWGDGTYYSIDKLRREPLNTNILQPYVFGEKMGSFIMFNQIVHIIVLIGIILCAVSNLYNITPISTVANITIFGVVLFLLIWETRSRYLVLYIPILLLSMIHGYQFLCDLVIRKENKELENE